MELARGIHDFTKQGSGAVPNLDSGARPGVSVICFWGIPSYPVVRRELHIPSHGESVGATRSFLTT